MSLRFTISDTFEHDIRLKTPEGDQSFIAVFKELTAKELDTLAGVKDIALIDAKGENRLLQKVFVGWKDVVDAKGNAVAFTLEHRDALLQRNYIRLQLMQAYLQAVLLGEAQKKTYNALRNTS